jgi:hypothetical protein
MRFVCAYGKFYIRVKARQSSFDPDAFIVATFLIRNLSKHQSGGMWREMPSKICRRRP